MTTLMATGISFFLSRDERGRNDDVTQYAYDYNHRNPWRNGDNNMFPDRNRNYPRNQNFNGYQSRDQYNASMQIFVRIYE